MQPSLTLDNGPLTPNAAAPGSSSAAGLGEEPRTPVFVPRPVVSAVPCGVEDGAGDLPVADACTPLFVPTVPPLLPAPSSSPPKRPAARRKTLAGVTGFDLSQRSPRLRAKKRAMPIAQLAEQLLCQRLGIVGEGEGVTQEALNRYVAMFQGQLPDSSVAALRALFRMDCDLATAVEEALLQHGGDAGPEMEASMDNAAVDAA